MRLFVFDPVPGEFESELKNLGTEVRSFGGFRVRVRWKHDAIDPIEYENISPCVSERDPVSTKLQSKRSRSLAFTSVAFWTNLHL